MRVGLVLLLVFGSAGDSQTPPGGLPPWNLQTATDAAALRVALDSTRPQWSAAFNAGQTLRDISFRPVLTTSSERIYVGGVQVDAGSSSPSAPATQRLRNSSRPRGAASAVVSSGTDGVHSLGYLHVLGSGCQTPPDQVFTSFTPQSLVNAGSSSNNGPKNSLRTEEELDFLLHILGGVSGRSSDPVLVGLHGWFTTQPALRLVNFQIEQSGAQFSCTLFFQQSAVSAGPDPVRTVHAVRSPAGGFGQVVIK